MGRGTSVIENLQRKTPVALTLFRFSLGFLFLAIGLLKDALAVPGWVLVVLLTAGVLSDIFDGVIARRLGVATSLLRRLDSQTDLLFWAGALTMAFLLYPTIMSAHGFEFLILIGLEALSYLLSFARFGKEPSTHAYSAKIYGLALFIGLATLLGSGRGEALHLTFLAGLISGIDVILILLLLRYWAFDVPSSFHAFRSRVAPEPSP